MNEHQKLTRLTASIYDAALDSAQWRDALQGIADFVGGRYTGLLAKDFTKRCVDAHYHSGFDPHYMRLYGDTYCRLGPIAAAPCVEVEQVVSIPELVPYDEFRRGRFYQEWARPQGWVDSAIAALERSTSGCAYLSVVRDEANGMVDDETRHRMAFVVPHVRRALFISRTIESKQAEAATFADILDGLNTGLFLMDSGGRIVHTNAAAHEILSTGDFLRSTGGRLVAADAEVDAALRETVAAAGNDDPEASVKGIALPLAAQNGDRYVAHVLPLTPGARRFASAATAAAAMFVRKAEMERSSPPEVIAKTYRLTPTELRVLLAIVDVGGVPEVADALGVAETTVKTHLSRLFEKTGAARQADLVKLVAGFSTPLAN